MRWIRFSQAGATRYGIVEGTSIREVRGSMFGEHASTGARFALAEVRIEIPVIPPTFYCVGRNYAAHVIEHARLRGEKPELPSKPAIGYRAVNALIADGEDVVIPADAGERVHYEGELVAVIGRKAKRVSRDEALSCVLGYTIGNDVSERDWQKQDRTFWRAKNTDTFKPMV